MKRLKWYFLFGVIFVIVTGSLSHFLYKWSGNNTIVGLFVPVNESVWEHMKLIFFPTLFYSLFLIFQLKKELPCITSSLYLGILLGTFFIPVFFYTYTGVLGRDFFFLDLADFVLGVILAFAAAYRLTDSCRVQPYCKFLFGLVCLCAVCFLLFTYRPPNCNLFLDPSLAG